MRLLVVDDHEVVRRGVRSLLSEQTGWDVCGEAVDGQDAVEKARALEPDLIVMDVSMPRLNGLEATRQIRGVLPQCEILVLSQHENSEMARQALKAGARGYVVKSSISRDLISAVAKASRHEYFFDPAILDQTFTAHTDIQEILQRSAAFEKALGESEERLRKVAEYQSAVMNNMAEGLYVLDANGLVTSINPAGEAILGWKSDELVGKKMHDVTHYKHPDGRPYPASECPGLQVVQQGIALREHEDTFIGKDGSFVPVVFSASPLREDGKIAGVIVSFRDDSEQRRAREALQESREQLALALDSSRTALFDWDISESRGKWNPQMAAIYEFTPQGEYITAQEWTSLFHPDDTPRLAKEAQQIWGGADREFTFEFRTVRRNGEIRWMLSHGRIARNSEGKAVRLIGMHTDITEAKRAEEVLARAESRIRAAFSQSYAFLVLLELDGTIIEANRAALDAAGATDASQLVGRKIWEPWWAPLPEEVAILKDVIARVAKGEKVRDECRFCLPDGTRRVGDRTLSPVFDDNGKIVMIVATGLDITDRKQSDAATGLLASIVASSDDAIVSKTLDGIITSWNKSAEKLFGYSAAEAVGQHITLVVPQDRLSEEADILARLRRGERIDHFETVRQRKDGSFVEVSLTISPVRDSLGNVVGASKIARDISARRQAERAIGRGTRQQKALFRLADEFNRAASLEHVYGAALNAILDALHCNRASILLCDNTGTMRFQSWRGLSNQYRAAVDGHSAWKKDDPNPQPVCVNNIDTADIAEPLKATVKKEGIAALAFIPLVSNGKLIGKFMTYFNAPHQFSEHDIELSLTIARQLSFAIERQRNDEALRQSEARLRNLSESLDAEVLRQTEQLRNLSYELLRAQDEERKHMGRELHDSVGQTLTALALSVAALEEEVATAAGKPGARVAEVRNLVHQLHLEIRTMSYLLHPPLLEQRGLSSALAWYAEGLSERSGIVVNLDVAEDIGRLPSDMELAIFRLVQEALTNVHRHSGSKTASIRLARVREQIDIDVADQGRGIPRERLSEIQSGRSGVGIRGMQELLRRFGGKIKIESNGAGTRVIANIPIPKENRNVEAASDQVAVV